jgi:site-specific DNA-methyltransferase (cytosine-N4-specific)
MDNSSEIILGDVRYALNNTPNSSIRTVITSPPYWGLRDYGSENQIGQEEHPDLYIENLVQVFREVKRILTDDGTLWVNIGDTYVGTGHKGNSKDPKNPEGRNGQTIALNHKVEGLKPKDMIGIPWKLAFALQKDGWFLRSDIIWNKLNALPSPVRDRPVSSYEHIFLLSKSRKYFYNHEAVKEPTVDGKGNRSLRDVWNVNTKPFKEAHFAVYPKELILPCVLAGSEIGDTIFDPFSGSGTTGIVALENGRNFLGVEANKEYALLAQKRILDETGTQTNIIYNDK